MIGQRIRTHLDRSSSDDRQLDVRVDRVGRRAFLRSIAASGVALNAPVRVSGESRQLLSRDAAIAGLVWGGPIGDALGGPTEFQEGPQIDAVLPNLRQWGATRRMTSDDRARLAFTLQMRSYAGLRLEAEPYGPWKAGGPAGTVTDDTRHKIVLMRTLREAEKTQRYPVTAADLARQYVQFTPHEDRPVEGILAALCEEGFREYRYAARWLLGERNPRWARPVARLWSGVPNCSGQMLLLPLAAAFPGQPDAAYRAAYALDFVDGPMARDMAASLVAALSSVLADDTLALPTEQRWRILLETLRTTDPWGYADVPFAGRPWLKWLEFAERTAEQADGRPGELYMRLERDGQPEFWWDAHFTLLVPLAMLRFCQFEPLAALHVTLDFRHDSDSYAQVLAALAGAVHGIDLFPSEMRLAVAQQMQNDFGEDLDQWCAVLAAAAAHHTTAPPLIELTPSSNED
jgi:hypothetical protein